MKTFVLINLVAGFAHYLFQVLASQRLAAADFSTFSLWLAQISLALIGAAILQYLSCFVPLSRIKLRLFMVVGLAFAASVSFLPLIFSVERMTAGLLTGILACVFALFSGQAQVRLLLNGLAVANLLVGLAKFSFALWPLGSPHGIESFTNAIVFCYLPATLLLAILLWWKGQDTPPRPVGSALLSTVILGAASVLFPQFELILMEASLPTEAFYDFARLSLFYKGIFFVFLIFSQWLLPHQLRGKSSGPLADRRLHAVAVGLAVGAALVGPWLSEFFLHWDKAPRRLSLFLVCWNMGLRTWIFLLLQEACARGEKKMAMVTFIAAFALVPVQLLMHWPLEVYYLVAIAGNALLLWRMLTWLGAKNPKSVSPAHAA